MGFLSHRSPSPSAVGGQICNSKPVESDLTNSSNPKCHITAGVSFIATGVLLNTPQKKEALLVGASIEARRNCSSHNSRWRTFPHYSAARLVQGETRRTAMSVKNFKALFEQKVLLYDRLRSTPFLARLMHVCVIYRRRRLQS